MSNIFSYPDTSLIGYRNQSPFPHAMVAGTWDESLLSRCAQEVNAFDNWDGEKSFYAADKKRYCSDWSRLPPSVGDVVLETFKPKFLCWLEELTSERGLIPDPYLRGGGIHSIRNGGYLKVHADFNWHEDLKLYRRLNLLLYFNQGWQPIWGGELELWSQDLKRCERKIQPLFNTMVIFTTDDKSYHGHPQPLKSPEGITRNSLALYYYSAKKPLKNYYFSRISTDYKPVSGDTFSADSWVTKCFSNSKIFRALRLFIKKSTER